MITLRNPRTGQMIDVEAPDRATAVAMLRQRYPNGVPSNVDIAPIRAPAPTQTPQHPQSQDLWRSIAGGLAQGVNGTAAPVGQANDTVDRLADMAARSAHSFGQMVGAVPQGEAYDPHKTAEMMHTIRQPWEAAGDLATKAMQLSGHPLAAAVGNAVARMHPQDVENATVAAANSLGGPQAGAQVHDVEDYVPQTATGRLLQRGASMLPAALYPGSGPQRALAVIAPTIGSTIGGEGARAFGASPQGASDAELLGSLLAAGVGAKSAPLAERAVTNIGDMIAGPRTIPTSGNAADLVTVLRGGARAAPGEDAATFRRSDLNGAANLLAQHVARVGRASGEDFGAMSSRVAGMGDQGALADALPDLARNVADRGSFGQQFLGNQLNQRQLGVMDPATGVYSQPSAAMRLDSARRSALGVPAGAFDTEQALTAAQQANAGPLYTQAHAQAPVSAAEFAPFAESPLWGDAYNRARGLSQVQMVDLPGGGKGIQALPEQMPDALDWRTLDLMKQGIQDKISENARQGIGAHEQGALQGYLGLLTEQQNHLNPTLGDARAAYAGPAAVKDAIDYGRDAYTMDPSELAAGLSNLSQGERQGTNVGFYQAGRDATLGRSQRLNAAEALGATNPDMMARNQALMGDNFGNWNTTLGNEATFFNTRNRALGGSATSRNLLGAEDAAEGEGINPFEAGAGLIRAAHLEPDGLVETAGNLGKLAGLQKLFAPKPSQMTEGTADVLGSILGTRGAFADPQTAALIQGLMDSAQTPNYSAGLYRPAALLGGPKSQDQGGNVAP